MPHRLRLSCVLLGLLLLLTAPPTTHAEPAAGWQSAIDQLDVPGAVVAGNWQRTDTGLQVQAQSGARVKLAERMPPAYDLQVAFTRQTGVHSIAVIFPLGAGQASLEIDAWGQHLAGIQNIAGRTLRDNATRRENMTLENGRRYQLVMQVRPTGVRATLDGQQIIQYDGNGEDLSVLDVWRLPEKQQLGIGAWDSQTLFHTVAWREVPVAALAADASVTPARTPEPAPAPPVAKPAPATEPAPAAQAAPAAPAAVPPTVPSPETPSAPASVPASLKRQRVLLVIANQDFFYREYADPRAELERAGIAVTVAAARRGVCRPHPGSGQGGGSGEVNAQLALAQAKAADYDAILFAGGWGSSAYQFAFDGRYDNPAYNGDPESKAHANRLIGEFLAQGKPTAALCNAVSVLAWARVDGRSPLAGKRAVAPRREAASGIYNGKHDQPSCRWHPQVNGAILSPAGAIGDPRTAADDVLVDGLIVTGEDDISAREMGRTLVRLLQQER